MFAEDQIRGRLHLVLKSDHNAINSFELCNSFVNKSQKHSGVSIQDGIVFQQDRAIFPLQLVLEYDPNLMCVF